MKKLAFSGMPNITKEPTSLIVEEGEMAMMDCAAEGLPKPRVYWVFNGKNVLDDGNLQLTGKILTKLYPRPTHALFEGA
jgi:hypothetical protein